MSPSVPVFVAVPLWRFAFWASYAAWFAMEMWVFWRDRRRAQGEGRDRGSRLLIVVLVFAGLFGAFAAAYSSPATLITAFQAPLFWTAIALIWAGMALRVWAVLTLGRFFRTSVFLQEDHRLISSGPYARMRNPAYTGGLVSMVGIGLAMGNWLSVAIAAGAMLIGYAWRIVVEERALKSRFGEAYEAYARHRWALIPFVW
jgi:protein-S-isoprenylcysteine O-methyltransferase